MGLCVFCGSPDEDSNPDRFVVTRSVGNRAICENCLRELDEALASVRG